MDQRARGQQPPTVSDVMIVGELPRNVAGKTLNRVLQGQDKKS